MQRNLILLGQHPPNRLADDWLIIDQENLDRKLGDTDDRTQLGDKASVGFVAVVCIICGE
jgi:hypothetical protein